MVPGSPFEGGSSPPPQGRRLRRTIGWRGQSIRRWYSSLQVELAEVGGQAAADDDAGPQQARNGDDLDAARGDDPGGLPLAGLAFESPVEHVHHDTGDDDEGELHLEHAVLEIVRGLRHPEREAAGGLEQDGDPDDRDQRPQRR